MLSSSESRPRPPSRIQNFVRVRVSSGGREGKYTLMIYRLRKVPAKFLTRDPVDQNVLFTREIDYFQKSVIRESLRQ